MADLGDAMHQFSADLYLGRKDPQELLTLIIERLHSDATPNMELCIDIGAGDLENLIRLHESELWPEIERLARDDERFRRTLASVWAYDSPMWERRERLLEELGESWPVTLRFMVDKSDFGDPPTLSWRARESGPALPRGELPRLLRSIADSIEAEEQREAPSDERD